MTTTDLIPLQVTAELSVGVAWAGSWGIALDGLLAGELHAAAKAADPPDTSPLAAANPPDLDLPLARCGLGPDWHWAATCAWPIDGHHLHPDARYFSAHPDHAALETLTAALPTRLRAREGRYRARWSPILTTVCSAVAWRAVGSPTALQALLDQVAAIGKKRATGLGHVRAWHVTPAPTLDAWSAAHLHPDGTLGRPTPAACLAGRDVDDAGEGLAGLRPPYVHPSRQRTLHLPTLPARP